MTTPDGDAKAIDGMAATCSLCGRPRPERINHVWARCGDGPEHGSHIKPEVLACRERELEVVRLELERQLADATNDLLDIAEWGRVPRARTEAGKKAFAFVTDERARAEEAERQLKAPEASRLEIAAMLELDSDAPWEVIVSDLQNELSSPPVVSAAVLSAQALRVELAAANTRYAELNDRARRVDSSLCEANARAKRLEETRHELRNALGNLVEAMKVSGSQPAPTVVKAFREVERALALSAAPQVSTEQAKRCAHEMLSSGRGYSPVRCVTCGAKCNCGRERTVAHAESCPISDRGQVSTEQVRALVTEIATEHRQRLEDADPRGKLIQTSPIPQVAQASHDRWLAAYLHRTGVATQVGTFGESSLREGWDAAIALLTEQVGAEEVQSMLKRGAEIISKHSHGGHEFPGTFPADEAAEANGEPTGDFDEEDAALAGMRSPEPLTAKLTDLFAEYESVAASLYGLMPECEAKHLAERGTVVTMRILRKLADLLESK